jgi:TonB-dependent receptor
MGAVEQANLQLTRMGWTAERSSNDSAAWTFTQTTGANWYDLNNYGRNDLLANNITNSRARGKTEQFVGQLNARYAMAWELPTFFKVGLFQQVTTRARESVSANTLTYVGPTGNQLTSPMPISIADFRIAMPWGGNLQPLPVPDKSALKALMVSHPEYFTKTVANEVANLDTVLGSPQSNQEQIRALYLMENTRLGKWQLQGGLRYENTATISSVKSPVPISKNPFANVTTNATTGVRTFTAASTFDYVNYRWSKGFVKDYGGYGDWLPSLSGKYQISRDLNLKLGYNKAIKRPALNNIAGQWSINAADTQITIPNPDLKPERSQKISAVLEYYFEPAGTLSAHIFETEIKGATDTFGPLTAAEAGFAGDPVYGAYEFITFQNVPGTRRIKGIELSYSQQLTFFRSEWLRGLGLFGSYSRFNSHPRPVGNINGAGWAPQNAAGGISWRFRKFNTSVSGTWVDESFYAAPLTTTLRRGDVQMLDERFVFDVNLGYKLSRHADLFISGRNAFNAGKNWYFKSDGRMQMKEKYGGQWTIGFKGNY